MSRHIRAQTAPTHASGFHLFTVAMIGHAKESRSERVGLYQNEQGGFACPGTSEDSIALHRCHRTHRRTHVYLEGTNTSKQGRTQSMRCNNMMHECDMAICCDLG